MSSTEFRRYGERGAGKWITIYAREGHTFAVIAGLRLDTTPFDHYSGKWAPRWYAAYRPPSGFDARHPIGLRVQCPQRDFPSGVILPAPAVAASLWEAQR